MAHGLQTQKLDMLHRGCRHISASTNIEQRKSQRAQMNLSTIPPEHWQSAAQLQYVNVQIRLRQLAWHDIIAEQCLHEPSVEALSEAYHALCH